MTIREVAYLGPAGTYSHLVAEKRFGLRMKLVPCDTIHDVCLFVAKAPSSRRGVVPIENSSGGAIHETVDILLGNKPQVHICEELALEVRLALLGHKGATIKHLYSHAMPFEHCSGWIRKHLPGVKKQVVASTAKAAEMTAGDMSAAALGSRKLASMYKLKILKFPVEADTLNLTAFLVIGGKKPLASGAHKTTLAVHLANVPGSLCSFLEVFRKYDVNLSRLISRPIRGLPKEYAFLVDVEGASTSSKVRAALALAAKTCVSVRVTGSYPVRAAYRS